MRAISLWITLGCLGLWAATARAGDREDLQGNWDLEGLAVMRPATALKGQEQVRLALRVTFTGDQVEIRGRGKFGGLDLKRFYGTDLIRGKFVLNPNTNPKSILIRWVAFSKGLVSRPVTEQGIYQLKEGKLMLNLAVPGNPAPQAFAHQKEMEYLWVSGKRPGTGAPVSKKENQGAPTPLPNPTQDPIVGKWSWFNGGQVTIRVDGTLVNEQGNIATWVCQDRSRRLYTLRWSQGGFVDTVTLSEDGQRLSGTNQHKTAVTASKVGPAATAQPPAPANPGASGYSVPGANAYVNRKDWNGLLTYCQGWARAEPGNPLAWWYLGTVHHRLQQRKEALPVFRHAATLKSPWPEVWNALGWLNADLRQFDEAVKAWQKAAEQNPKKMKYWNNLAAAHTRLVQWDQALAALDDGAKQAGPTATWQDWYMLGDGYWALKAYQKAKRAYQRSIQLNPSYGETWNNLGVAHQKLGNRSDALKAYQKAAALGNPLAKSNYAELQEWLRQEATRPKETSNDGAVFAQIRLGGLISNAKSYQSAHPGTSFNDAMHLGNRP